MVAESEEAVWEPDSGPGRLPRTFQPYVPSLPAPRTSSLTSVPADTWNCALNHCCVFMYQEKKRIVLLSVASLDGVLSRPDLLGWFTLVSTCLARGWYHSLSQTLPWALRVCISTPIGLQVQVQPELPNEGAKGGL